MKGCAVSHNHAVTFDIAACHERLRARQTYQYQTREQQRLAVLQGLRDAAQAVFSRFPHIQRADLFGSVLRPGALRVTSDIDIAVEGRLTAEDYFALWRAWEGVVGYRSIDLLELGRDIHFADRIRDQGLLIYEHADSEAES
jgi:predicted nucleotidyltransferase